MDEASRRHVAGLMRVNHVGEVCAQALYEGHALTVRDDRLSSFFMAAAEEERDHLAWTRQRLRELSAPPSVLIPVWYLGSLSLGSLAGLAGGRWALGFMAETERQVEAHLQSHLERLPESDSRSRAIIEQMKKDETRHGEEALLQGGARIPKPIAGLMRFTSRIMTTVAYRF
jgi:ubiquinone biosynthesis monooxygenase Coq7